MAQLLIYLQPNLDECQYWWQASSLAQAEQITASQAAALSQQHAAVVILPSSCLRLDKLTLPAGVKPQEAALLLEDELCQALEETEVKILQQQGKELLVASYNAQLALTWPSFFAQQGIQVQRWVPEALCWLELYPESNLVLQAEQQLFLWQPASLGLVCLATHLAPQLTSSSSAWADYTQVDLNNQTLKNYVPWLAKGMPPNINLWRQTLWQKANQYLSQQSAWAATQNFLTKLNQRRSLLLPWSLVALVFISTQTFTWLAQPSVINQLKTTEIAEQVTMLNLRFDAFSQHLGWQAERLAAWQELTQVLEGLPHLRLEQLVMDTTGLQAEIHNLNVADQAKLESLQGKWEFNPAAQLAVWQLEL